MSWSDPTTLGSFDLFSLCSKTLKGLTEKKFTEPTRVQQFSLVHSLKGFDVVVAAKTGSGKTLAFLIPLLELLYKEIWSDIDGIGALIISPTRELAQQIFEVLIEVGKYHTFSAGLVIGGKDLKLEWKKVSKCNIMICTPGRLLHHMSENPYFNCDNVQMVILDEADQCLSNGFSDTMNAILHELPKERQTLLFSATQTRRVKDLIRAGCNNPVFCSVHEHSKVITPISLKQSYVVCEEQDKITFLFSFLTHHRINKIIVFFATCKQVKYFNDLFIHLRPGLSVMALHGKVHQLRRMAIYSSFSKKSRAVLFATDVAARGLDIPNVDWVLHLDCPEDVTTYIHRSGRTARHISKGESLLMLTSSQEVGMIDALKKINLIVEKIEVDPRKFLSIHTKVGMILNRFDGLREIAERCFKSYIKSYAMMKNKVIFNVEDINYEEFAKSLGLISTPRVRFVEKRLKMKKDKLSKEDLDEPTSIETSFCIRVAKLEITENEDATITTSMPPEQELNNDSLSHEKYGTMAEDDDDECSDLATRLNWHDFLIESKKDDQMQAKQLLKAKKNKEKKKLVEDDGVLLGGEDEDYDSDPELHLENESNSEYESDVSDKYEQESESDKYERESESGENSDESDEGNESEEESKSDEGNESEEQSNSEETVEMKSKPTKKRVFMGKKLATERFKQNKRAKLEKDNQLDSIPFEEKEQLALFLLKSGR